MELVIPRDNQDSTPEPNAPVLDSLVLPAAADLRGRRQLLAQLEQQFQAGGEQRVQALAVCSAWRHRDALPLIRRGLRDSNCQVAALAAEAMAHFRGRSAAAPQPAPAKAPRNVSRTR
jgi:hypothetical protein